MSEYRDCNPDIFSYRLLSQNAAEDSSSDDDHHDRDEHSSDEDTICQDR